METTKKGLKVRVAVSGNDINILENEQEVLYIYLNDNLLNLDKR
ncbi:hypothetical protein [Mucilaginibacter humi]|nr:hypothetical protein [Mucilaginibacter humi]